MWALKCARAAAATLAAAAALSGCGSKDRAATGATRIRGKTLTVYVSAPLSGASRASGMAVVDGVRLASAQAHGRVGEYQIALKVLDDATVQRGGWDPGQTTINARAAVLDPTTIGYVGEVNSGASAISIPPLNRAGIAQVSPTSAAVGLTSSAPGAFPGEPQKYYPSGVRTFVRVVPNDTVQAIAQVRLQQSMGCTRVYVLDDGEVDGADTARSYLVTAQKAGLRVIGIQAFVRGATSYQPLALGVAQMHPDCVLISADTESGAVPLTTQLVAAMPEVKIFGSAGLAETTYADPAHGGIPLAVDSRVVITGPSLDPREYPAAARAFTAAFDHRYGSLQPGSIFGYEAMSLLLSAIDRATEHGTKPAVRSQVRAALFATRDRPSVLGTYSIDGNGDTTLRRYGVYGIVAGRLTFWQSIVA
ncbi:MAG: branched-chain amino acid ABC transporter substrate-binding protein [Solirubrobacterales bacterium]|nr:branched-chain amino acid ABC transporter substrate-binding protein [Solirubrobacterales bacterium]MBV9943062.1 branched-chain amino acid ABC transporter substrate-binding protein [Solirubrobacterales bacterium]